MLFVLYMEVKRTLSTEGRPLGKTRVLSFPVLPVLDNERVQVRFSVSTSIPKSYMLSLSLRGTAL